MLKSLQDHVEEFERQGFTVFKQVLAQEQADELRNNVEKAFEEPAKMEESSILRKLMFEKGEIFENLIDQPGVVDFAEEVLGKRCHMIGMTAIKTPNGTGIDRWHVDEELHFPLPEGEELDPRIRFTTLLFTCIYYLVDVTEDMGPTQLIPGSHRSGRHPNPQENSPTFKGQEPVSILAKAGDCLIFNGQTWHRGAKNISNRPRIVQQVHYGRRWISQRFYPFVNYTMPPEIIERANPRRRRLLGMHEIGAYG
jgi:ectoine hydroxylase-related dioxygenase (phytanoyl-CoA dioxygenase family)